MGRILTDTLWPIKMSPKGLLTIILVILLSVTLARCDESKILRPSGTKDDVGKADAEHAHGSPLPKGPRTPVVVRYDSDAVAGDARDRRFPSDDGKRTGPVRKSPAAQSSPEVTILEDELQEEEEPKSSPDSKQHAPDGGKRKAENPESDISLSLEEANNNNPGEHEGAHDSHHPMGGPDPGRKHDVKAFHPGLDKRMENEEDIDDDVREPADSSDDPNVHANANKLPALKKEESLPATGKKPEQTVEEDSFTHGRVHNKIHVEPKYRPGQNKEKEEPEKEFEGPAFTLFTIANTDIGSEYSELPYREKYQWQDRNAPCHTFNLKVPDELTEKSNLLLCIFRPSLEFPDETKVFIANFETEPSEDKAKNPQKVFGYVVNNHESTVYGKIIGRNFYGEVSTMDKDTNQMNIYVIEEIILLNRLMRSNMKTLRNMLMVMHAGSGKDQESKRLVYNAVVTKGASLINFMMYSNPNDVNRNPFMLFSTNHNSYICSGEPTISVDETGEVKLESANNKIEVETDGSVHLNTLDKEYIFRPNGRTIVRQGMNVKTLQEHEGSVAITAYSSQQTYDCVLPTPAFQPKRKGGYVCRVCLALDDLFIQHYLVNRVKENEMAQDYMARIIDRVSWIFRAKDLDGDKRPDNIGIDFDTQPSHWNYPNIGSETLDEQSSEILFQSLEQFDFADCCLGLGYTMKKLPDNALGKRPSASIGPSGICSGRTGRIANNLILISANNHKGNFTPITEEQLIYLTANQIAEAFGAMPDGSGNDLCDQFIDETKQTRHFLMWPDVLRNTTQSEQRLSPCSKNDIVKTLSTCKSSCFDIDKHPFCGNGIVEEGEECDCGSEQSCKTQTCCFSRLGKRPCRKSGVGCKSGAGSIMSNGVSATFFLTILLSTVGALVMA